MLLYSSFSLLILLSIALFLFYNQNQKLKYQKRNIEDLQKELHHRIRNNLAIISGLIDASAIKEESTILSKDLKSRIMSISFVHEYLYQQDDVTKLNLQNFVEKIMENLIVTYSNNNKVLFEINANILIDTRMATQLALIITELLTNSLKHGYKKEYALKISVAAKLLNDTKTELVISDNGPGLSPKCQQQNGDSYGLKMVLGLIRQIKGEIFFSNINGSNTRLIF
jgi:two-component sensor histidine kinase